MIEPYYVTHPVMDGKTNSDYIVLDRRWGMGRGTLAAFSIHIHGEPEIKYNATKAIGSRGNSLVVYLPKAWGLPAGTLCVVEVTPIRINPVEDTMPDEGDEEDAEDSGE